jgi:CDGSH-type Zn-finger protein
MAKPKPDIRVSISKDGPYIVSGSIPLAEQTIVADAAGESEAWKQGKTVPTQKDYALCRCGHSKMKPFCDGSHLRVKFDGSETASRKPYIEQAKRFDGPVLALTDAQGLCAFGRFCDPHGQVWNQVAQTDDPKVKAMFLQQVAECPAGRLVAWDKATGKPIEPKLPISIGLVEDPAQQCSGPLWLRGGIAVISEENDYHYEIRNRVTLCRCGASKNKPFCDGTHAAIKFRAT